MPRFSSSFYAWFSACSRICGGCYCWTRFWVAAVTIALLLSGCGAKRALLDDLPSPFEDIESSGGLSSILADTPQKSQQQLGVNAYLWAAALDVIGDLPLEIVNPTNGVIVTKWYRPNNNPEFTPKRVKIVISSVVLDSKNLDVIVESQANPPTINYQQGDDLALLILRRARELLGRQTLR